jgi:drug/metabolite transporter (DMT)-like permease
MFSFRAKQSAYRQGAVYECLENILSPDRKALQSAVFLQVGVAIIWGGSWVAGRIAVMEMPALLVAVYRVSLATLMLFFLVLKRESKLPAIPKNARYSLIGMGFFGILAYSMSFFYGLKFIQAGQGALVVALTPISVAFCSWLWMGERLDKAQKIGMLIGFLGCLVVISHGHLLDLLRMKINKGQLYILGCVVCWTIYTVLGRTLSKTVSSLSVTFYASLVGTLLLLLVATLNGDLLLWPSFSWKGWLAILFLGLINNSLAYVWYAQGLKILGTARTAVFTNLVPVSALFFGGWLLNEKIEWPILLGGGIIILGVGLTNKLFRL